MNRFIGKRLRYVSFRQGWDRLRVSFWFAPLVMACIAILLTRFFYFLDSQIPNEVLEESRFIISGSSDVLRSILIGMASTTLATAGVVFTLLTLPLSTVSSQYGSRLLRVYLGDRTTQIVLGLFTGSFCFSLFTALLFPPIDQPFDVPQLTITFALALFLATFGSLIALIHHISTMLQAPKIVAAAGAELRSIIHLMAPDRDSNHAEDRPISTISLKELEAERVYAIQAYRTGYIQSVDLERILRLCEEADGFIRLVRKPGHFVRLGDEIAVIWPTDDINQRMVDNFRHSFLIENQRTPTQDLEYAVNQLVEVALRAMSPAINDPFTAMTCLDHIGAGMVLYVALGSPRPELSDGKGQVRLIFEPTNFNMLLAAAFDMIRHASCDNAAVLVKMLEVIEIIGQKTQKKEHHQELWHHAQEILAESEASNLIEADKRVIRQRCEGLPKAWQIPESAQPV